jgi:signal transduction histidine kinase
VQTLTFTVDSRLLRELGERLVGRPHIALAELVKNSYDADASEVIIKFLGDRIEVVDDGHGMSLSDFKAKWLRIGSPHKERELESPKLRRPLTGSKGVGRLAVQLIANKLELHSVSDPETRAEIVIYVDWHEAVDAGDLTKAPVRVEQTTSSDFFARGAKTGTSLILTDLNQSWGAREFTELAREIWPLQSPFQSSQADPQESFRITLESPYSSIVESFDEQMHAVLDLWTARMLGELLPERSVVPEKPIDILRPAADTQDISSFDDDEWDVPSDFSHAAPQGDLPGRVVRLSLQLYGDEPVVIHYRLQPCDIDQLSFEIRVFNLQYRQPKGIKVQEARSYLRRFGGVHVYDAGFHLPYYGPDTDWLHIEIDHSHRLSRSRLLPRELQRPGGMESLPTNSRLFGVVNVNTAHEQRIMSNNHGSHDALAIQVSRDRLTETPAYRDLVTLVRWALDYYAMNSTRRIQERARPDANDRDKPSDRIKRAKKALRDRREDLPDDTFKDLSDELDNALHATEAQEERYASYLNLLGALATAGISAVAYEHEVSKQFELLHEIINRLRSVETTASGSSISLNDIADQLEGWLERASGTYSLLSYLRHEENRTVRGRFHAVGVVERVISQVRPLNPNVTVDDTAVPQDLRLAQGSFIEWSAILQNLLLNAFNATRRSRRRRIDISAGSDHDRSWLLIQDTGSGIDLERAETFFDPFVREMEVDPDHAALALGGTGLGLTIVRMIGGEMGVSVRFIKPDRHHSTAVQLMWKD